MVQAGKARVGGDFSDAVVRLIEAQAAGSAADASSTAAIEAASGALSRAFAAATVDGPAWVRDAVSPRVLAQIGRDLIRRGDSMHVIRLSGDGVSLIPASSWHFEGNHDPASWTVRATCYGPSTSTTWTLPAAGVVFVTWGSAPGQPYVGTGPTDWAHVTARLQAEAERSLADEARGPLAQLIAIPQDGKAGDDADPDPLAPMRKDIAGARGKALLIETTAAGWGEGKASAPHADWKPHRLGPAPDPGMVQVAQAAFLRTLAACGTPPDLFAPADGTAQRGIPAQMASRNRSAPGARARGRTVRQTGRAGRAPLRQLCAGFGRPGAGVSEIGCRRRRSGEGASNRRAVGGRLMQWR